MSPARPTPGAWIAIRVALALLVLAAIGRQLTLHLALGLSVVNFFSFFTILSNLFAAVVLLAHSLALLRRRAGGGGGTAERVRGASVAMMAVVGLGFSVLLRDVDLGPLLPWVNAVTHYLMPVFMVLDWLVLPPRHPLTGSDIGPWLGFPLAYLVCVLVRGSRTGWYPYPFLDPAMTGGYGEVALYCLGILVAFLAVSWGLVRAGRRGPQPS